MHCLGMRVRGNTKCGNNDNSNANRVDDWTQKRLGGKLKASGRGQRHVVASQLCQELKWIHGGSWN
jgi:hypothetical protein